MQIHTVEDYRRALEALQRLPAGADDARRRELEAAVEAFAQVHNNATARPARPDADPSGRPTAAFDEDR